MTSAPATSPETVLRKPVGTRRLQLAIASAAIPAVVLSSAVLAQPAAAGTAASISASLPQGTGPQLSSLMTGQVIPTSQVPAQIPHGLPVAKVASSYTVKAGDTVSSIAAKHGLATGKVLQLNGLRTNSLIFPGQKIKLTGANRSEPPAPQATPKPSQQTSGSYTVKAGDTLGRIAANHGVSLGTILSANGLSLSSIIYPGQRVKLAGQKKASPSPAPQATPKPSQQTSGSYTVKAGDTLGRIAANHGVSLGTILSANGLSLSSIIYPGQRVKLAGQEKASPSPAPQATPKPSQQTSGSYTVKAGDTLGRIAANHGVSLGTILSANGLRATDMIHPGLKIALSGGSTNVRNTSSPAPSDVVPSTFGNYTYPSHVVSQANVNKQTLNSLPAPSREQMKAIISDTARGMGVDARLALAFAYQESGFDQRAVSPANAIGAMQVIPMSGQWASDLVGRKLNLLDPYDNATAGVAIIRALVKTSNTVDTAIASYYQGQFSVSQHGMFEDTKGYVRSVKAHMAMFG